MLNLTLNQQYFNAIKAGIKTVEGRLNKEKFHALKPGDTLTFTCKETGEILTCTVTTLHVYPTFEAMLQSEGLTNILPGANSIQEGVAIYESFPGFKEDVKEFGALAIGVRRNEINPTVIL